MDITKIYNDYMANDPYTVQLVGNIATGLLAVIAVYFVYRFLKDVFGKRAPKPMRVDVESTVEVLVYKAQLLLLFQLLSWYLRCEINSLQDAISAMMERIAASKRIVAEISSLWRTIYDYVMRNEPRDYDMGDAMMGQAKKSQETLDAAYTDMRRAQKERNAFKTQCDLLQDQLDKALIQIHQLETTNQKLVDARLMTQRSSSESEIQLNKLAGDRGVSERNQMSALEREVEVLREFLPARTKTNDNTKPPEKAPAEKDKTDTDQTDDKKAGGKGGK